MEEKLSKKEAEALEGFLCELKETPDGLEKLKNILHGLEKEKGGEK